MANRAFFQMLASLVERLTLLQGSVLFGSTGAVTSITGNGIKSVALVSTGLYDVTLSDPYNRLMGFHATVSAASAGTAANVCAWALDALPNVNTQPTVIRIQALDFAGAKVAPASGSSVLFDIILRNSGVKGQGE